MTAAVVRNPRRYKLDVEIAIEDVWNSERVKHLAPDILSRGITMFENRKQKDILITGFAPVQDWYQKPGTSVLHYEKMMAQEELEPHWQYMREMLFSPMGYFDFQSEATYLDLFYFRHDMEDDLEDAFTQNAIGRQFLQQQLNITRYVMEHYIKPKVILVMDKAAAPYWPRPNQKSFVHLGYQLKLVTGFPSGFVYQIQGMRDSDHADYKQTISNLKGTYILFSNPITEMSSNASKPTPRQISLLLDRYHRFD